MMMQGVLDQTFPHCDIALYLLHLQAVKSHRRMVFKRQDLDDVRSRMQIMYPPVSTIPNTIMGELPPAMSQMINTNYEGVWRIEWMFEGDYIVHASMPFKSRYRSISDKKRKVYPKLACGLGFSKYDNAHRLWLESLMHPGQVVKVEGIAYHWVYHCLKKQTVKMMSHIIDYNHVITMTIVV